MCDWFVCSCGCWHFFCRVQYKSVKDAEQKRAGSFFYLED